MLVESGRPLATGATARGADSLALALALGTTLGAALGALVAIAVTVSTVGTMVGTADVGADAEAVAVAVDTMFTWMGCGSGAVHLPATNPMPKSAMAPRTKSSPR